MGGAKTLPPSVCSLFKRPSADAAAPDFYKKSDFKQNRVFNVVWAGFEVGFGISVKNHADP